MPRSPAPLTALLAALVLGAVGCTQEVAPPPDYVARVGDAYLTEEELTAMLAVAPAGLDSLTAREQVVEQWVTAELMAREAEARGLREQPEVQRQLADNERAVLAAALVESFYEEEGRPSAADLDSYFERNRERLQLREPYVRVRLLEAESDEAATEARQALQRAMLSSAQDSLWEAAARAYAADTALSLGLARLYVPESRLLHTAGEDIWEALDRLGPGQISPVLEADSAYYVLQLVDRAEAGTAPELGWIEDDVRRQVSIQSRKQLVARQVQQLRNAAEARNELEVRLPAAAPSEAP